jgi:hypothetical protein
VLFTAVLWPHWACSSAIQHGKRSLTVSTEIFVGFAVVRLSKHYQHVCAALTDMWEAATQVRRICQVVIKNNKNKVNVTCNKIIQVCNKYTTRTTHKSHTY